jgi:hypothetical protein
MQSQMIGLQTSLDRILAAVTQPGAPGVMPPGPPIYPQTIREGPGYVTNVSGTRTGLDPQTDPALMQDQPPSAAHFPSSARLRRTGWSILITSSHTHIYLSPTSMVPTGSPQVPLPRLRTNMRKLLPDCPSMPPSKHCKDLRIQQQKQRLLPRSLHPSSCDIIARCE